MKNDPNQISADQLLLAAESRRNANSVTQHPLSLTVVIDGYRSKDCGEVLSLLEQLWPNKELNASAIGKLLDGALNSVSRVLLCARHETRVVGFGSMTVKSHLWHGGNIAWVDELVVDSAFRGRGIGSSVLSRLIALAKDRGCSAVELDSAFHRLEAHKFYETLGFSSRAFVFSKKLTLAEHDDFPKPA